MDYEEFQYDVRTREQQFESSLAFPILMRKVYLWMTFALAITGMTSYYVASSPAILQMIYGNPAVMWGLIIAEFGLVFGLSAAINKLSLVTATLMFVIYSIINGATLSVIFLVYDMGLIAQAFFITAGTFVAMVLYGYTTKKDLTTIGSLALMGLIGIIIASVVNIFIASSTVSIITNYVAVLVFVGLTAYDTQKIKNMMLLAPDSGEKMQKIALLGALSLYLDFINLFIYILRILGSDRK